MVGELLLSVAVGFVVLVAASYVGTAVALRGFFGRAYFDPDTGESTRPERETYRDESTDGER